MKARNVKSIRKSLKRTLVMIPFLLMATGLAAQNKYPEGVLYSSFGIKVEAQKDNRMLITLDQKAEGETKLYVQQFRWNKWITWDSVTVSGGVQKQHLTGMHLHCGENYWRIIPMSGNTELAKFSFDHGEHVTNGISCGGRYQVLPHDTDFEIYDVNGYLILKGYGSKFDRESLRPGVYYLNYDNITTEFIVKRK